MVDFAMLKRFICLVLLLCCVMSASLAEIRYVDNGTQWDARLNLRTQPSKSSQSLGRYYTGVRVQVMEDLGEWSRVRIATGFADEYVEGYMMNSYLVDADWLGMCQLPYVVYQGQAAYVMGYTGSQYHILYADGRTGYMPSNGVKLSDPAGTLQLIKERVCTPQQGAVLYNAYGQAVANLYGGVFLNDGIVIPESGKVLVSLQDENDEVRGLLPASGWTWTDNGANCEEQYAVYESENGLVEVLGEMADGRTILRLTTNSMDAPQVVLTSGFHLTDLTPLQREGSYYRYTRPLLDEESDSELISRVYAHLDAEKLSRISGCTAQVERLIDFQYGHCMLRVRFVNAYGQVCGIADIDGAIMIWQDEDNG